MHRLLLLHLLAVVLLYCATGFGLPYQLALHGPNIVTSFSSDVITGGDANNLLRTLVDRLNHGTPEGWEGLMRMPDARGSYDFQTIFSDDLGQAMDGWGLHPRIRDQVYQDIRLLVTLHAQEAVYASQEFRYDVPDCNPGELPVCFQTVIAVVRRIQSDDDSDIVELRHIYVETVSNAIQQIENRESCHNCWFHRCCHNEAIPIPFNPGQLNTIQSVLSTKSAWWAYENMPANSGISLHTENPPLSVQLRQFVNSNIENEDVFKYYDDVLLSSLQGSMQSTQQRTRSFSLSLKEQNLPVVGNLIAPCLKKANIDQSLQEMWQQAQEGSYGMPLSLECQNVKQVRVIEDPPSDGCNKSAVVTINTQYSWVLLSPLPDSIECIFIGSDTTAVHNECEITPTIPDDPIEMLLTRPRCHKPKNPKLPEEGSIARLSIPEQEGRFSSVRYLTRWPAYTKRLNKAIMDISRYAGAHAFLRIPVSRPNELHNLLDDTLIPNELHNLLDDTLIPFELNVTGIGESMLAIGTGMSAIGEGWSKISNAIGPHSSEVVKRQVCLGFKRYEHTIKAIAAHGIPQYRFEEVVDALIKIAKVKNQDVEELRDAMIILEYTDDATWRGQTVSYTSDEGFHRFFHFYKYTNQTTNTVDIAFGTLAADFTIAPDTLIIEKKEVGWFGLRHEETTEFRDVPHTISYDDTLLLNAYFEVVVYRQMAAVLRQPVPEYPSMASVCTIS
ncbi:hypothetical protein EC991_008271 [Linnemannia zychae]|nr:hypothetical protein EC991_008271 [Linnemannia zychae]